PVSDPALSRIAEFFRAVVNKYQAKAWEAVYPRSQPTQHAFTHNPEDVVFNERDQPSFYLYRTEELPLEWYAEDVDLSHWKLRLLWIFPPCRQEFQRRRSTMVNGITKTLEHFIELGNDPAYIMHGDPDPKANT